MKHYRCETKCSNCGRTIYDNMAYKRDPSDDFVFCAACASYGFYYYYLRDYYCKCEKCGRTEMGRKNFCSECGGKMVEVEP